MGGIAEEENRLFAELRLNNPDIIDDGVASEEDYLSAKYKIMYLNRGSICMTGEQRGDKHIRVNYRVTGHSASSFPYLVF